jgi:hypothetical protein
MQIQSGRTVPLKGPKLEIFGSRVFSQIRPIWVGDLGKKMQNFDDLGLKIAVLYFFSAVADIAKNISPIKS